MEETGEDGVAVAGRQEPDWTSCGCTSAGRGSAVVAQLIGSWNHSDKEEFRLEDSLSDRSGETDAEWRSGAWEDKY